MILAIVRITKQHLKNVLKGFQLKLKIIKVGFKIFFGHFFVHDKAQKGINCTKCHMIPRHTPINHRCLLQLIIIQALLQQDVNIIDCSLLSMIST